jgi:hypothetical protein
MCIHKKIQVTVNNFLNVNFVQSQNQIAAHVSAQAVILMQLSCKSSDTNYSHIIAQLIASAVCNILSSASSKCNLLDLKPHRAQV